MLEKGARYGIDSQVHDAVLLMPHVQALQLRREKLADYTRVEVHQQMLQQPLLSARIPQAGSRGDHLQPNGK